MPSLGLSLRRASLAFHGQPLFSDIACELPPASWTCLLGRSGSGKSSLLRMIAGLPLPEPHTLDLATSDRLPLTGRIAWMAQQDLLLPWRRVIDNVLAGPALRGRITAVDRQRAHALLDKVGLASKARQWPAALSGGQRQRVALARTLFEDAPLVLMDEPFSALDAITRLELHELTARLLQGRTVILVTHDPLEALRLGDQLLILGGDPARLEHFQAPAGQRPRSLDDLELQRLQARLVARLSGGTS
ncbi:ATP-binding cassette domain-containing protein [Halomonas shantousis]